MLNLMALDRIFDALGDPTRRWIVEVLCDREDSVSQLAEPFALSLTTILQHVKALEQSGLIHTQKYGRERRCRIEPQALRLLDEWVTPRRRVWDTRVQWRALWP